MAGFVPKTCEGNMSAVHVPSVPRGMLLPSLDTHRLLDEEEPADPTPPGSHVRGLESS